VISCMPESETDSQRQEEGEDVSGGGEIFQARQRDGGEGLGDYKRETDVGAVERGSGESKTKGEESEEEMEDEMLQYESVLCRLNTLQCVCVCVCVYQACSTTCTASTPRRGSGPGSTPSPAPRRRPACTSTHALEHRTRMHAWTYMIFIIYTFFLNICLYAFTQYTHTCV
jgi:hypothetical protein